MVDVSRYKLNLKGLAEGEHTFSYCLDSDFFEGIEGSFVHGGEVDVFVKLVRLSDLYRLYISLSGFVMVDCDRCLSPLEEDVSIRRELIVKLGAEFREDSDEIMIIPEKEAVLNLGWLLYEDIVLALPLQRVHKEGACDEKMMDYYHRLRCVPSLQDLSEYEHEVDQRWSALKQLKIDTK